MHSLLHPPPPQQVLSLQLFWWFVQAAELETLLSVTKLVLKICASCQRGRLWSVCVGVGGCPSLLFVFSFLSGHNIHLRSLNYTEVYFVAFPFPSLLKAPVVCCFFPKAGGTRLLFHSCGFAFPPSVRVCHRKKVFSFRCLFKYRTMMKLLDK